MVQATFKITAVLDTPIEDVWAFVSDVTNQDHWVAGMSGSAVVGGGAIGVGSEVTGTSRFRGQDDTVIVEVTEFEPPRRVSWRATSGGAFPFITQIVLTAQGEHTTAVLVRRHHDQQQHGVGADDGPTAPPDGADLKPDVARGSGRLAGRA